MNFYESQYIYIQLTIQNDTIFTEVYQYMINIVCFNEQ